MAILTARQLKLLSCEGTRPMMTSSDSPSLLSDVKQTLITTLRKSIVIMRRYSEPFTNILLGFIKKHLRRFLLVGAGLSLVALSCWLCAYLVNKILSANPTIMQNTRVRDTYKSFFSWLNVKSIPENRKIRQHFRQLPVRQAKGKQGTLHQVPRATRSAIVRLLPLFAQLIDKTPFYMQPRSSQADAQGSHYHFWSKDIDVLPKSDQICENSVVFLMDSDYYTDMTAQLTHNPVPHVLYTFDPIQASSPMTDYTSYHFKDEETIVTTSPHNAYEHKLWNYNVDTLRTFSLLGCKFTHWTVEKRRISDTHSLVLINPLSKSTGFRALASQIFYGSQNLHHVNVGDGPFAKIEVIGEKEHYYSIARKNESLSVKLPVEQFYHVCELARSSKLGSTIPKIKTKVGLPDSEAAILNSYINENIETLHNRYKNYKIEWGVISYQMFPSHAQMHPKASLDAIMRPLYDKAFSPANTLQNAEAAIQGRLTQLQDRKYVVTERHYQLIYGLVDRLIASRPDDSHLYPADDDVVFDNQPRPQQQQILKNAIYTNSNRTFISMFVKKEAYGAPKDPRIISTLKPADKLAWSKIMYPLSTWIKRFSWYAFGKTPAKIGRKIARIAKKARFINCTDFSRMDGRKTILTRTFNLILLQKLFPEMRDEIYELCGGDINTRGVTPAFDDILFTFFCTRLAWASGHPLTSIFNTFDNLLINFTAFVNKLGGHINDDTLDKAFAKLSTDLILGGDDTLVSDLENEQAVKAAAFWGHVITSDVYIRGAPGVNFFSRLYGPDLWNGDPNSCTDIIRALSKLHVCPNLPVNLTPSEKLAQKLTSIWFTDRNTPIFSIYLQRWKQIGGKLCEREQNAFQSYWSQYDPVDQFVNIGEDWMMELIDDFDIDTFMAELSEVTTIDELMALGPYNQLVIESKRAIVVDHEGDQELIGTEEVQQIPLAEPIMDQELKSPPKLFTPLLAKKINSRRRPFLKEALDIVAINRGINLHDVG